MGKYNKRIVKKITDMISSDDYTVSEICTQVGLSEASYFQWKLDKPEFLEALQKAEDKRLEVFRKAARSGLLTLLQGKEIEETVTEMVDGKKDADGKSTPRIKLQRRTKKVIMPNPTSVIFALKNLDEAHFRDVLMHTGENGGPIKNESHHIIHTNVDYSKLTDEQLQAIIAARIKIDQ